MICTKCKREIDEHESFCPYCGATVTMEKETHNYCSACGYRLKEGDAFCPNCGSKVDTKEENGDAFDAEPVKSVRRDEEHSDLEVYVGKTKYTYYKSAFKSIESEEKVAWNWCAFLFGGCWLFYRKLFLPGFIYIIVHSTLIVLMSALASIGAELSFSGAIILLHILLGLFCNNLYYKKYQKDLKKAEGLTGNERTKFLFHTGYVNSGYVFIPLVIWLVVNSITNYLYPTNIVFDAFFVGLRSFIR